MMNYFRQTILLCFLFISMFAGAQSFDSLKRSSSVQSKLYKAISEALQGKMSLQEAKSAITEAKSLTDAYDGKTPVYLLMDFIATHPTKECVTAESLLESFAEREDFDGNLRYRSLVPPLSYLIRENYRFLGNRFSSDYISMKVIKLLVEKGASVNSYNTDGGSLMTFARETNNVALQDFILGKNIDLTHNAKSGKNEVYSIIERGDVELLKKVIANGSVNIDVTTIENDLDKLAAHKEAYDMLAVHCANRISNYNELMLFLQKFKGKKELVAKKYQEMANNEFTIAKSFDNAVAIAARYPDADSLIKENKLKWYKKDCSRLLSYYEAVLAHARNGGSGRLPDDDFAADFVDCYGHKHNFDPDRKLSVAMETSAYRNTVLAMQIDVNRSYWAQEGASGFVELFINTATSGTSHRNKFYKEEALKNKDLMENCMKTLSKGSGVKEFQAYFDRIKASANKRYSSFMDNLKKDIEEYEAAVAADAKGNRQFEERRKREKAIEKQREQELEASIENMSLPAYTVTQDWTEISAFDLASALVGVFGHNSDRAMKISFKNNTKGWIGYVKSRKVYIAGGTGEYYSNLEDAITAEYAYRTHGKTRQKGRK
nr:hypothetical protein [uncultured Prevotella sp.]